MKKDNLKKLIGAITLGLAVTMGAAMSRQVVKATTTETVLSDKSAEFLDDYMFEDFEEQFGYAAYGFYVDGSAYYKNEQEIRDLVKVGFLSEKEADLEIQFLKATTDDEKDRIYKQLIDETKGLYGFSDSEAERLKNAGYKNYNRVLDEIFYDQLVNEGFITRKEADLEIQYNAAANEQEREAVYDLMVDNMVDLGKVTKEQGEKLKGDGYKNYYDNMSNFDLERMVSELFENGVITKEKSDELRSNISDSWGDINDIYEKYIMTEDLVDAGIITRDRAIELRNGDSYESWKELYELHSKYSMEVAVKEGQMTQEEADLWMAYVYAQEEEDIAKAYNAILDYEVRMGIITQEEADFEREFGF